MKSSILLFSIFILTISCKKNETEITEPTPTSELPNSFIKRVLLEDFSKQCVYCIPVNDMVDSMRNSYTNNELIPVIISCYHQTQISQFDSLNTIFTFNQFPTAAINRVPAVNSGSETGNLITNKQHWSTNVNSELTKSANLGIKLNTSLNGTLLDVSVSIGSFINNDDYRLTVYIIENDAYYRTLKHVPSSAKGDPIAVESNKILNIKYEDIDLSGYNIAKTSIIAFAHKMNETTMEYEVLNVNEVTAGENCSW